MIMRNKISRLWASSKTCERSSLSAFAPAATTAAKWCFVMQRLNGAPFAKPAKAPFAQLATANHKAQVCSIMQVHNIAISKHSLKTLEQRKTDVPSRVSLKDACLQNHLTLGVVSEPQWCQPQRGLHQSRLLWQEGEASAKALFLVPLYTCQAVFQWHEMHYLTCTSTKAKHLLAVSGSTSPPACDCLTCADKSLHLLLLQE
jgi:hypothetical protein